MKKISDALNTRKILYNTHGRFILGLYSLDFNCCCTVVPVPVMLGRFGSAGPLTRTDPIISKTVARSPGQAWALFMGKVCFVMPPQSGWRHAGLNDLVDCYFVNRIVLLTR